MGNADYLAITDIDELGMLASEIEQQLIPSASVSDRTYLQIVGLQILMVSKLEYLLKSNGNIKKQYELLDVIAHSNLTQLEKDHLSLLICTRHTLVHNDGRADERFLIDINKYIKSLKVREYKLGVLSSCDPFLLPLYFKLIKKLLKELGIRS